ncbi:MAG: hypothetical protein ACM3SR_03730 [Ignavibacteriales bacterium]
MIEIPYLERANKEFSTIPDYRLANHRDRENRENKYSKKYILRHLMEKQRNGVALFYFRNRNEYITLSLTGQLNVRGEEDMFRPWGSSEFRNLKPQAVFEELEKEISKVKVISAPGSFNHSFNSYGEFIGWLAGESEKR